MQTQQTLAVKNAAMILIMHVQLKLLRYKPQCEGKTTMGIQLLCLMRRPILHNQCAVGSLAGVVIDSAVVCKDSDVMHFLFNV